MSNVVFCFTGIDTVMQFLIIIFLSMFTGSVTQKGKTSTTQSKTAAAKQTSAGSAKKTATKK